MRRMWLPLLLPMLLAGLANFAVARQSVSPSPCDRSPHALPSQGLPSPGLPAPQEPSPPATPQPAPAPEREPSLPARTLVLQNLAPFPRREGVACVVPFAEGVAGGSSPELSVNDQLTVWQPFGARWPDGSWRQALCLFQMRVPGLGEVRLPLLAGGGIGAAPPAEPIAMPAATITFVAQQGERVTRAEPQRVRDLESNALRRVELRRGRIGDTGLVAEVILTAWRDQQHADVAVAVFFSDASTQAMQCDLDELAIECHSMALVLRHPGYLGIGQTATEHGSRTVLLRGRPIGDGQGLRRVGVLVPQLAGDGSLADQTLRAATVAPLLAATSWQHTGAFGPYGAVPEPPPWLRGAALRQHFAERHRAFVARERPGGDAFGVFPHGLQRMAGQTGDQDDFGTVKLSEVAFSGMPSMLLEVELSVLQEACRPVHFFAADASPVDPAEHPDWIVWSGRTHWHGGVSKDRLGKPVPEPRFEAHGWTGKDRQHWSSNYLSAYALLTGSHWARLELENEARLYLAGQTLDGRHTTSNSGAPRGGGRVMLSAAWNLCVRGDERLRQRMNERMDQVYYQQWAGRELASGRVRTMAVNSPDDRQLRGAFAYWNPWQDALAAVGFGAMHRMTGNARARELAEALAVNVVQNGWLLDQQNNEVAMAMRWLDGAPFTAAQWQKQDDTLVQWSHGTAFSEWSIGAVEIARVVAVRDGDEQLAQKAAEIQRRMRTTRKRPGNEYPQVGGMDRFGQWDAVVWDPE